MDPKATVQALFDAVQKGDFEKAKSYLSADFKFSGPVPEPINGDAWLGMSMNLKKECGIGKAIVIYDALLSFVRKIICLYGCV